jgi:hypothetical protein
LNVAKHTEGSWITNETSAGNDAAAVYTADEKRFICSAITPKHLCNLAVDDETRNANCRLIAAAPDLLAACQGALRAMRTGNSEVTAIERLVAAIEKAGGQ